MRNVYEKVTDNILRMYYEQHFLRIQTDKYPKFKELSKRERDILENSIGFQVWKLVMKLTNFKTAFRNHLQRLRIPGNR